ncbi:TMEM175 family protein [Arenimonas sp.]|uniref:TMEM175 family protein n=1 Tax=Arenimonas sp. TaxID=1872635 RepID=UPI0025BB8BD7|nr:TMEM175 family protein [Arenimonas sp.]
MVFTPTPRRMADGFLERGGQVTRVEAFVDAAFAFALTLLVISVERVPTSISQLLEALKGVPAFAASFLQLAMFWVAHARWSRRYGMDDRATTFLSLLLVFLALVYIYPLKLLFGTFFAWITGGWLPSPLESLRGYSDIRTMFMVYGIAFATLSLCIGALYSRALKQAESLGLDRDERAMTAGEVARWWLAVAVAVLSAGCAALLPDDPPYWLAGAPGLVYFLMNLSWLVARRARDRSLARSA